MNFVLLKRYIPKKIIPIPSNIKSNTQQLAAITNEIRMLGYERSRTNHI